MLFVCPYNICTSLIFASIQRDLVESAGLEEKTQISSAVPHTLGIDTLLLSPARHKPTGPWIECDGNCNRQRVSQEYDLPISMTQVTLRNIHHTYAYKSHPLYDFPRAQNLKNS